VEEDVEEMEELVVVILTPFKKKKRDSAVTRKNST